MGESYPAQMSVRQSLHVGLSVLLAVGGLRRFAAVRGDFYREFLLAGNTGTLGMITPGNAG